MTAKQWYGLAAVFLGGWSLNLAGWNVDFAQFSPVDVPFPPPIGHVQFSAATWFISAIILYVSVPVLLYWAGKQLRSIDIRPFRDKPWLQPISLVIYGVGVAGITTAYVYQSTVNAVLPVSYGQVWNALHFLVVSPAALLFLAATIQEKEGLTE